MHILFVETFLDGPNAAIAARRDDLLPLSHRFPCRARVISTDIATLSARKEVLGGRGEVGEAGVMHGLSQAQGVICDLYMINRRGQRAYPYTRGAHTNIHTFFARHSSPGRSISERRLRFLELSDWGGGGEGCCFGAKAASTSQTESSTSSPP